MWSFRDWFVWFVIFGGVYGLTINRPTLTIFSPRSVVQVAFLALLCSVAQVFIIISLDYLNGSPSRPVWADFTHLYSKRWLQYLFIFAFFWLLLLRHLSNDSKKPTNHADASPAQIQLNDGKQTYWLTTSEIFSVEAAGNYICVQNGQRQIIARGTIKGIEEKLRDSGFMRVSRSHIVSLNKIKSCQRVSRSKIELELINGTIINVGPTYWSTVRQVLNM